MKKLSQREKILDNYIYFKTILPQSFSKIHIPKKKNIVSSKFILPNYIFNYNDNMSTNKKKDIFKSMSKDEAIKQAATEALAKISA